ncbi:glutamate--tRNA ligase [Sulfuracidifex tepidarius]|nr:glutamate--tRNA ligase [Sulfuracidifex tepidarius]
MEEIRELARKYALQNAYTHGGKAQSGSVVSKIFAERPDLKTKAREIVSIVNEVTTQVNSMSLEDQRHELEEKYPHLLEKKKEEKEIKTLPELPNLRGKVVTRFAPNPDGPLHLGNSRAAIISYEYAKMYKGDFILRFDDTDPKVKKPIKEAYGWIREDLKWLGISWTEEFAASSRFERYYDVAKDLIEKSYAYVDTCNKETFLDFSMKRISEPECLHRSSPKEKNLELWEQMLEGKFKEGEAVLRIKTDMDDPDPSQRDWVMFRVINTEENPHPLTGNKYTVFPTYNFATSVDDHDKGVTHVFRAKEHMSNSLKQKWVFNYLNWEFPIVMEFGRLKLEGFMMSKSKIKEILEKGVTRDDPRLSTLAGLRRRGILPDTIKEIIIEVGLKTSDATISFDNIAAINRKKLDKTAKRYMYIPKDKAKSMRISGMSGCITAKIPFNFSNPNEFREIKVCEGDEIILDSDDAREGRHLRLMDLCNVRVEGGNLVYESRTLEEGKAKDASIVQWVKSAESFPMILKKYNGNDEREERGFAESSISSLNVNDIIQFFRYGFVRIDEKKSDIMVAIFSHD